MPSHKWSPPIHITWAFTYTGHVKRKQISYKQVLVLLTSSYLFLLSVVSYRYQGWYWGNIHRGKKDEAGKHAFQRILLDNDIFMKRWSIVFLSCFFNVLLCLSKYRQYNIHSGRATPKFHNTCTHSSHLQIMLIAYTNMYFLWAILSTAFVFCCCLFTSLLFLVDMTGISTTDPFQVKKLAYSCIYLWLNDRSSSPD